MCVLMSWCPLEVDFVFDFQILQSLQHGMVSKSSAPCRRFRRIADGGV